MKEQKERLLSLTGTGAERTWLTERLETLSAREEYQLAAAMLRTPPRSGADAVNCLLSLEGYEVMLHAGSYDALGRQAMRQDGSVPESAEEFVDTEALGRLYEDDHPGLFIGSCYVQYPAEQQQVQYTGANLYLLKDEGWSVRLKLASARCPEGKWLRLPDYSMVEDGPPNEMAILLHELRVDNIGSCELLEARCVLPNLQDLMEQYVELADLIYDGNDLGFVLDERGQGMPDFEQRFHAAMEYEGCTTLKKALDISQNLRCYDLVPVDKVEAFAKGELAKQGFDARASPTLAQCMDYTGYGKALLEQQGYQLTGAGDAYVRRNDQSFHYERTQAPVQGMTMK